MTKIDRKEWVLVCDSGKALFLENTGDRDFPNLVTRDVQQQQDNPATHEQGTDAPGRGQASPAAATVRSAMDQTDWRDLAEQRFLGLMAERLDRLIAQHDIAKVMVVAPPRALKTLRRAYSPAVRSRLKTELAKDYVRMPVHEIERHLSEATP